jgi:hypothetical protein
VVNLFHYFRLLCRGRGPTRLNPIQKGIYSNAADVGFYKGKLQAARCFLTWEVPGCHPELAILEARNDVCLGMQDEWF